MQPQTIYLLNQLNRQFYQTTASAFDASRHAPWQGWHQLLPFLSESRPNPLRVWDVGCGNGRFGLFLAQQLGPTFHYTGWDNSPYLLDRAHSALKEQGIEYQLQTADVVEADVQPPGTYDLIALFGVLHHIPSVALRHKLIHALLEALTPQGQLWLSTWAFYELERFRARVIAWEDARVPPEYQTLDLEAHDYLLDWRSDPPPALRYCHYVSSQEASNLLNSASVVGQFSADQLNHYYVVTRP
jgi:SAM-dependent methyltransferase